MKTIKFAAFLFYRYYSAGRSTANAAYFSTLCAMAFIFYMHIFQILIITHQVENVLPLGHADSKPIKYVKMALVFLPIFFLLSVLIKEKELKTLEYPIEKVRQGNILLILYVILTFSLLIALMVIFRTSAT